jgi:SynChlorMet cassette radical SAM/SPASM protein ScmF
MKKNKSKMRETQAEKSIKEKVQRTVPQLGTIYFYLTEGCNLACRHCWIAPKYQAGSTIYPSLSYELFVSIIKQAKPLGLGSVKLTGGEPLLHPQILEILRFIRAEELGLTIETNGLLCKPEIVEEIKQCKNAFVSVSLDGARADTHEWVRGVEGSFEMALTGIRNLVAAGFKPQIIMSIMRRNVNEIEDLVALAEEIGAGSVKFNIVQPTARGERMHEQGETLTIEELLDVGERFERELEAKAKVRLIYSHPYAFQPLSHMFGQNGDGCGRCSIMTILGVLGDGSYALCGIGESVPELIFGQAATDPLERVWRETPILNEIREGLPSRLEGICGECVLKGMCLGSCVAQNYYRDKHLFSPFWYCEEAKRLQRFPESRQGRKGIEEHCVL